MRQRLTVEPDDLRPFETAQNLDMCLLDNLQGRRDVVPGPAPESSFQNALFLGAVGPVQAGPETMNFFPIGIDNRRIDTVQGCARHRP